MPADAAPAPVGWPLVERRRTASRGDCHHRASSAAALAGRRRPDGSPTLTTAPLWPFRLAALFGATFRAVSDDDLGRVSVVVATAIVRGLHRDHLPPPDPVPRRRSCPGDDRLRAGAVHRADPRRPARGRRRSRCASCPPACSPGSPPAGCSAPSWPPARVASITLQDVATKGVGRGAAGRRRVGGAARHGRLHQRPGAPRRRSTAPASSAWRRTG